MLKREVQRLRGLLAMYATDKSGKGGKVIGNAIEM
jgi:hypothetical protein